MKRSSQRHSIENVFVLVLFAIFAMTIVAVLALGANQYKSLVERDNNAYNKRIITSYVSAQIRGYDRAKHRLKQCGLLLAVFDYNRSLDDDDKELIQSDRKSTRLNSSHTLASRMPSSA